MQFTVLIIEPIVVGCQSFPWMLAVLFRDGRFEFDHLTIGHLNIIDLVKTSPNIVAFIGVLLAYPVGVVVSAISYVASWPIADYITRKSTDVKSFDQVYVYVLQHGSEPLIREIQGFHVPAMRISRGTALNFLVLGPVLLTWKNGMVIYALLSICMAVAATAAFYIISSNWKGELIAAYTMLKQKNGQT